MYRTGGVLDAVEGNRAKLWLGALVFFVVGDVVTTGVGLSLGPIVEIGPVVGPLLRTYGLGVMLALKAAVLAGCYCLYRCVPRPHDVGVPLGLALLGVLVTGWNLTLMAIVLAA